MRLLKVATCSLNQWAMDFDTNMKNIKESISRTKEAGAAIRLGPELEITGYGCEDHFLEQDTITHAWQCLKELLVADWTDGLLCSFGMPVVKGSERYNCMVLCLNRKIVMIRPKMWLANGGSCGELRWFTAWKQKEPCLEEFLLPSDVAEALSQTTVPFGYGYIQFPDTAVAAEICMELFSCAPVHPELALNGVEVFMNASGSIHELRKMERRLRTIMSATHGRGGVYMYSNHIGCDGGRAYYDGCSCIILNGDVVAHGLQYSLKDVDLVVAQIDLDMVGSLRVSNSSFQEQASCKTKIPSVLVPFKLCQSFTLQKSISSPIEIPYHCLEEEIALGAACWLWNYLRRSGASGFLLPLSGGIGSSAVASIVGCMCQLVVKEIRSGDEQVIADAIRIGHYAEGKLPMDSKELANRILYTVSMESEYSSKLSRLLAEEIGSWHLDVSIDRVVSALLSLFQTLTGRHLHNKEGGRNGAEISGLENIRSRSRMVIAYTLAMLFPWIHNKPGFFLVLCSTTADDGLCGNLTKYGCSSGDINLVGNISKKDLQAFLRWAAVNLGYSSLSEAVAAHDHSTASESQQDESGIGMTDDEISVYLRLRKNSRCGPVSMFKNLCCKWSTKLTTVEIAEKVKHFFRQYSMHRHKMTVLTPSYLVESSAPEDNRSDQRQFLYNTNWAYQFREIDQLVQQLGEPSET
ncbi:glutamine-dependent NAD(+) synthetase-like isoform X3 [Andrographis paniculata]|uniref:glutamine-dependent NAD(+) synthetase-like isoform X3 n=1 Tax=Andrographis paniculata TaxID=175694 RepID=UPI0021E8232C|nr:glutamine-dependent NAD(+) synthetase-like isoform X3 [Andrographis paniculata]